MATNTTYNATLNMTGGAMNAFVSSLIIGEDTGGNAGFGGTAGTFTAGTGTIDIGPSGNTANFYAGYNITTGGVADGTVDFSSLSSMNANLNNFLVGASVNGGGANGNVKLAVSNNINATNIVVGANGGGTDVLTLGQTNTIAANQFTIAQDMSTGTVTLPAGGSLALGSSSARTFLTVGNNSVGTNSIPTGTLNTSGGSINAYLSSMIVGQDTGGAVGGGGSQGFFTAGTGTINIGVSGNTANIYVGNNTSTGGVANGSVDFSSLSSLNANLNNFSVGISQGGSASGTVKLAAGNTINANNITIGSSGGGSDSLVLGGFNTILVNQLTIGQDYSTGSITISSGGVLNLGSATQLANLTMAVGTTNTNATYGGTFDMSNATLIAYLNNVIIGNKNSLPGTEVGTWNISSNAGNFISANSIALGGNQSTGTINYGGGNFYAGSITAGSGSANFNWTGGTLSVGAFGSPTTPFSLSNTGKGTLAPALASGAIGTTTIYGNYTQGSAATTAIRIAGDAPTAGNDQVNISQTANLAGNLSLQLINSFVPSVGENFLVETYASHSGTYAFVAPPSLPQNVAFQLDYSTPTQLMVRMVNPVNQNYVSTAAVSTFGAASNWNTSAVPNTTNTDTINNSGSSPQTVTVAASTTVHKVAISGTQAQLNFEIPQGITLGVSNELLVGTNSILSGGGTVDGNVVINGGSVNPGATPAVLDVTDNYSSLTGSTLALSIDGKGANNDSSLAVGGLFTMGGALQVTLNGYTPSLGDSFQLFSFGSVAGDFSTIALPALPNGLAWNDSQLATTGDLSVVTTPEPAGLAIFSIACAGLLRRRSKKGRTA